MIFAAGGLRVVLSFRFRSSSSPRIRGVPDLNPGAASCHVGAPGWKLLRLGCRLLWRPLHRCTGAFRGVETGAVMSPCWWRASVDAAPCLLSTRLRGLCDFAFSPQSTRDLEASSALSRLLGSVALCVTGPCARPLSCSPLSHRKDLTPGCPSRDQGLGECVLLGSERHPRPQSYSVAWVPGSLVCWRHQAKSWVLH